ncbi:transglutaminase domain-containing protein [Devosia algicola]|uniref:Transglutaminase domain-containing protein n=1 Tax=Devosia algicola TaxID=3026418 RepID=A0ABY7YMI9_9HYPH|nr:transglutaminase domain-containing protein [Devosia algicola]WDR02412.1 transglutaminase domain-containing protein [Devosia algicola]
MPSATSLSITPPEGSTNAVMHLLLTPQSGPTQTVESWSVSTTGIGNAARFSDAFGNTVHLVNQARPEGDWVVSVTGVVNTIDRHGVLGRPSGEPVPAIYKRSTGLTKSPVTMWSKFRGSGESRLDILHGLMARVGEVLGDGNGGQAQSQGVDGQSQSQVSEAVAASAHDLTHSFIGAARALDIPARFVTGYVAASDDNEADFHAWAEAYDDDLGWIGFDCLLQMCPSERHVRLAAGLDAISTQPLRGAPDGDSMTLRKVSVEMVP